MLNQGICCIMFLYACPVLGYRPRSLRFIMKKTIHLEVIRMLAILGVIYIHTGPEGHDAYTCTDSGVTFAVSLALVCLTSISAIWFWMVSGALLIGKKDDVKRVYKKRIPRIFIVLLTFSVIKYFYDWFMGVYGQNMYWASAYGANAGKGMLQPGFGDFLTKFIAGGIYTPYWFLYSYIVMLIFLPFIRNAFQGLEESEWKYLAAIEVVLLVLSVVKNLKHMDFGFPAMFPDTLNAFILGYVAEKVVPDKWIKKTANLVLALCLTVVMVAASYVLTVKLGNPAGEDRVVFTDLFSQPIAFCLFLFVRGLGLRLGDCPERLSKVICYAGGCTFGLYLTEEYFRHLLWPVEDKLAPVLTMMPACFVWVLCTFLVGILVVGVLKKIPGLRKLL